MKEIKEIIERMQDRIMRQQKKFGYATVFDFLNEDLDELTKLVENNQNE